MKTGDTVYTPRFCTVKIATVFSTEEEARDQGFITSTDYKNPDYKILGRSLGMNRMDFAAIKR